MLNTVQYYEQKLIVIGRNISRIVNECETLYNHGLCSLLLKYRNRTKMQYEATRKIISPIVTLPPYPADLFYCEEMPICTDHISEIDLDNCSDESEIDSDIESDFEC